MNAIFGEELSFASERISDASLRHHLFSLFVVPVRVRLSSARPPLHSPLFPSSPLSSARATRTRQIRASGSLPKKENQYRENKPSRQQLTRVGQKPVWRSLTNHSYPQIDSGRSGGRHNDRGGQGGKRGRGEGERVELGGKSSRVDAGEGNIRYGQLSRSCGGKTHRDAAFVVLTYIFFCLFIFFFHCCG